MTARAERLGAVLHAVRQGLQLRRGGDRAVGAEPGAGVDLQADEVVARGGLEELVLEGGASARIRSSPPSSAMYSWPTSVMPTGGDAGAAEHVDAPAVQAEQRLGDAPGRGGAGR